MNKVKLGPDFAAEHNEIAQIVSLEDLSDNTALCKAKEQDRVIVLIGQQPKTAVFLRNGLVVLTPLSITAICRRLHKAMCTSRSMEI